MYVVAESGVGHLEAGIVDAVAVLRGAGGTVFVVEGYDRYNCGTECVDSHLVAVLQRELLLHFTLHVRQHEYETDPTPRVQRTLTPDPYG